MLTEHKLEVITYFSEREICQAVRINGDLMKETVNRLIDLREQGVRDALIKLGWTPPPAS